MVQRRAASFASSAETSLPALPVYVSLPSLKGSWPAVKRRVPARAAGT